MRQLLKCFVFVMFAGFAGGMQAQFSNPASGPGSASTVPQSQLMQPTELVKLMKSSGPGGPVIFQVGSYVMFQQAHIPNSGYAGPTSQANGLILLKKLVAPLKKDQLIVIYCGCCPWGKCPNIGPAYKQLRDLGFTNVKALYLAKNFGDDWMSKGFPVERGE
ncbi:MAG: rhodanese-like domain-containing protein [Acidobacteria bacterium]|nr:rhodanese-like domain-containing protein [Acidobacteriota bacterium]